MDIKKITFDEAKTLLNQWREDNERRSEDVITLWEHCICYNIHKLGDDKWVVYEQVSLAALDLARLDIVQECIHELDLQFPGSFRVRKLKAMQYEAMERYEDALKMYDTLLENDEANCSLYKRKIAVLRSQGKIGEAIKQLNDYLKKFACDQEAWAELCELYLAEQDYAKAGFCAEELILSSPHNHLYHQQYAEILYTSGGDGNLELARLYFARALKLNPNNLRALYGLFLTTTNLANSPKALTAKRKENQKYAQWCSAQISKQYKEKMCDDSQLSYVQDMLNAIQIA